jgi:hypothetical protein
MSTTIETLAPYLPYGVEVDTEEGRMQIAGVWLAGGHELTCTDLEFGHDYTYAPEHVTPVLWDFADLCTPLPDGTVPLIELAVSALKAPRRDSMTFFTRTGPGWAELRMFWLHGTENSYSETLVLYEDGRLKLYHGNDEGAMSLPAEAILAELRRRHFAFPVNGKPMVEGQDFIRKTA